MKTAAFIIVLIFICCEFTEKTTEVQLEGFAETVVQSECRDRYLWVHVASGKTRFEAVDGNGVHAISEQLASRCGYTISTFKMDGFTTFRASYYSCFTHNQNDELFTFRFNVMVSDTGRWISQPVSAVCSGLTWTNREIICEEDYMEVNVNRRSSCGGKHGDSGQMWQAAVSQAQRTAGSVWQLVILQNDGQVSSMSISEAQKQGYSLTTTAHRVVLRTPYKQPHAELIMVDGVPTEVVRASLFLKQKLMMMMVDVSMACTVNSGSFDGTRLLWEVPRIMTPLVGEGAAFESRSLTLGVEGLLLDKPTMAARGFTLVQQGHLIQIGVPLGAEGGYRKAFVENNMYKETYVIFLMYEHVFSLLYEDGSSIETRHRMLRVLDTPLLCRPPFSLDRTMIDNQVFSVYLGNIPADVLLEEVQINRRQLMSDSTEHGYSISPVVHINGSRAYELHLPFEDAAVRSTYLGRGVVQFSIDINFTLTIMPQRDSYYHHTFISARLFNAFPPEITAQCSDRGITFSMVPVPRAESLWEVGIDREPLTSLLVAQRGYRLHKDTDRITLEVPVFSIGYDYDGINLSNFYGTFKLLLRDSKTLEVQTSTSKRCLFKTQDMIACSADGSMTVVTTLTSTWPTVQPERTTLLDTTCGPQQTDGSRALFQFKLDSCGTRAMVGESYMVYQNEILHDRQIITDGPNFISRESQFKLTVRCFYPLSGVNRLSVDRIIRSGSPGFGSVEVFKSVKADSAKRLPVQDCLHQVSGNAANTQTNHVQQTSAAGRGLSDSSIRPWPKPAPSNDIKVPAGQNELLHSSKSLQTFQNLNQSPNPENPVIGTQQVPLQTLFHPPTGDHLPIFHPRYDQLPDNSVHLSKLNTPSIKFVEMRSENLGLTNDNPALGLSSLSQIPGSPVVEQFQTDSRSSDQTLTLQGLNGLGDNVWNPGLTWDQPTPRQSGLIKTNQNLEINLLPGIQKLAKQHEANLDSSLDGSLGVRMETSKTQEVAGYRPRSQYNPSQTSQLHPLLQPPVQYIPDPNGRSELVLPDSDKTHIHANTKHTASKNNVSDLSVHTQQSVSTEPISTAISQADQNLEKPGSIERRNTDKVMSRVQNIQVKPLTKLPFSGHHLEQRPSVQQANSQISIPSQYATGRTAVRRDGNRWMSKQLSEHRDLKIRDYSILMQRQSGHSARVKLGQTAVIRRSDQSPDQQGHGEKLVQPVAELENSGGQESASTQRKVLQPTGDSHIRVRLFPALPERVQRHDEAKLQMLQDPSAQFDSRGGASRTSYPSLTPQTSPNTPVNCREDQANNPKGDKNLSPTFRGAGFTGSRTVPNGHGGSGLGLNIHTSDCSQYGVSIHQGIMRGKPIS